jgi:hypothetical protein
LHAFGDMFRRSGKAASVARKITHGIFHTLEHPTANSGRGTGNQDSSQNG